MEKIRVLYDHETIQKKVVELSNELYKYYGDEEVVFVCTLKGAVFFFSDLTMNYKGDSRIEFIRVSSYEGENSTGEISLKLPLKEESIKGKKVLIVEDIIDTGKTMTYLHKYIKNLGASDVKSIALLDKKSRRVEQIDADYVCFEIPDLFVIGYGLDYDQKYRNLPYIGVVENN